LRICATSVMTQDLFDLHADICKTLASPARLRIIDALRDRELAVGEIGEMIGARKANVSQHLAVMRRRGIIVGRRSGTSVYYRLASPKVLQACELMRQVLIDQMTTAARLLTESEAE